MRISYEKHKRLTLFAIPKPFEEHIAIIQRNAVTSWKELDLECEIVLFGDEAGTEQLAEELGLRYHPEVARNEYGTPLVNSLFQTASRIADSPILCYVNADIILMSDFVQAFNDVMELGSFLMVGGRTDINVNQPLDFTFPAWERDLKMRVREEGKLRPPSFIDYFLFHRELYRDAMPPFAVGRTVWDSWLIYHARKSRIRVVDATASVTAVHQNHTYNMTYISQEKDGTWKGPEAALNRALAGKHAASYNIEDATLTLKGGEFAKRKTVVRARRFLVTRFPGMARKTVSIMRRLGIYGTGVSDNEG